MVYNHGKWSCHYSHLIYLLYVSHHIYLNGKTASTLRNGHKKKKRKEDFLTPILAILQRFYRYFKYRWDHLLFCTVD